MKSLIACITFVAVLVSAPSFAKKHHGYQDTFYDYGRVIRVKPVFYRGNHDRQCYRKEKRYRGHQSHYQQQGKQQHHSHSTLSTVTGAVVGSVIGNSLGNNSKQRRYTTVAGAVIGGAIGHELGKDQQHHTQGYHTHNNVSHSHHNSQCSVSSEQGNRHGKIKGYNVTYRYKGEKFNAFTRHHPGNRIRVHVQVTPAVYN